MTLLVLLLFFPLLPLNYFLHLPLYNFLQLLPLNFLQFLLHNFSQFLQLRPLFKEARNVFDIFFCFLFLVSYAHLPPKGIIRIIHIYLKTRPLDSYKQIFTVNFCTNSRWFNYMLEHILKHKIIQANPIMLTLTLNFQIWTRFENSC